jgi:hypothetical protein
LPKIWGNIAFPYATVAAGLTLFSGCNSEAPLSVAIAAHYVPACAPSAEDAPAQLELSALGDFDRSNDSVAIVASDAASSSVALPAGTRAAELSSLGQGGYWGSGKLGPDSRLPILLWPRDRACTLARLDTALPLAAGAWQLGAADRLETLLLSGPVATSGGAGSLYVDLKSAAVAVLTAERGPRQLRREASLSELGEGLVLAGGLDVASGRPLGDAELFDPSAGRFTGESLALVVPRARHAALALPGGRSLLIGGESDSGQALGSVEILSADPPHLSRAFELLAEPRVAPRAVLLGQSRILVGGGYVSTPDGRREPVASVEFLSLDLTDVTAPTLELEPAALDRAFVALGSGGALAVGGCAAMTDASDCAPCAGGCVSRAVWWIDPRGTAHELEPLPLQLSVAAPRLVFGAGARPWLIAGGRLGRFDPWLGRFEPAFSGRSFEGEATIVGEPLAIHPGLFAWLEATPGGLELVGFYHSQRGPYAQDIAPLLVGSAQGIAPHLPPGSGGSGVRLAYAPVTGLELSGSAAGVSVSDTRYATFTLELSLAAGPPPLIQLVAADGEGDASFGGLDCPWPAFPVPDEEAAPADPRAVVRLRVQRSLDQVRLERLDGTVAVEPRPEPCRRSLPERVGLQLVGTAAGVTRLSRIEIRRSLDSVDE